MLYYLFLYIYLNSCTIKEHQMTLYLLVINHNIGKTEKNMEQGDNFNIEINIK